MPADTVPVPLSAPLRAVMYHSVANRTEDPYQVTVSPGRLERQLGWLSRRGLTGVTMDRLLRARAQGRGAGLVGLTFDDGYADFLERAVPLLRRFGFTATVFVLPGRLGGTNEWDSLGPRKPLLTEDGIRAVVAAGMEIGSHGLRHTDLTKADDALLTSETARSRALLRELTGAEVAGFCYPYGTVDARVVEAVRAAGYSYGCAINPGPLTGVFALPRIHVGEKDTALRLRMKWALHRWRREPAALDAYPVGAGLPPGPFAASPVASPAASPTVGREASVPVSEAGRSGP
ncbi:polysaccharide deacetylase family protein [Streptomyces sp. NPDC095613]|uniref:polysaccharide deacetylase family protein n=1 Tax=Streptomyces sp. NPDC095613 TaxID=3155540 RepID=UPI00331A2D0E